MLRRLVSRSQKRYCNSQSCSMLVSLRFSLVRTRIGLTEVDSGDCFHPNLRLAEAMSIGIWNEMLVGPSDRTGHLWQRHGMEWNSSAICVKPYHRFTAPDPNRFGPWEDVALYADSLFV